MDKKFQAVNIILSARQAPKREFELENPVIELDCFAINSEGYEDTITTGVKLGDGEKTWKELSYLTDVTPTLVTSWIEFETSVSKARLVTLPDTNFVYDLSEEFQNEVEEKFNENLIAHKKINDDISSLENKVELNHEFICQEIDRLDNKDTQLNDEINQLKIKDYQIEEAFTQKTDQLSSRIDINVNEIDLLEQRLNEVEENVPIELIFSGGTSADY